MTPRSPRRWFATSGSPPARAARWTKRRLLRGAARVRSGSVAAHMDRIVAEANAGTVGRGWARHPEPGPRDEPPT